MTVLVHAMWPVCLAWRSSCRGGQARAESRFAGGCYSCLAGDCSSARPISLAWYGSVCAFVQKADQALPGATAVLPRLHLPPPMSLPLGAQKQLERCNCSPNICRIPYVSIDCASLG